MPKLSDYATKGDSVSLAKIDGKAFTVVGIADSNYEDGDRVTNGVKLTTKESYDVDGKNMNKFHTTRVAVVKRLSEAEIREDVKEGLEIGPLKCVSEVAKNGKRFFNLVDA